jgi:type IV pilus assembly protein PilA
MLNLRSAYSQSCLDPVKGFTLIELIIVIAIISIIFTLALPLYSNYMIRAKVGEALSIGIAGATTDPVLLLTGKFSSNSGKFTWTCATMNGQNIMVPEYCRS